jgi:prophage regulatory protein
MKRRISTPAKAKSPLQDALLVHGGTIRVSFDLTPDQLFQLLSAMEGPIKIKGKTRTMYDLDEVLKIVPVSKSTLKRLLAEGSFPTGHFISPNRRVWYEDEILRWQDQLVPTVSKRKRSKPQPKRKPAAKAKKRATRRR